jgi:hypothetical protein
VFLQFAAARNTIEMRARFENPCCKRVIANSLPVKKARNFISGGAARTSCAQEFDRSNAALDKK